MARQISVPVAHDLPKEVVRQRMKDKIGSLGSFIPGGGAAVQSHWPNEDRMALAINALGQSVEAFLDIQDKVIVVTVQLPGMLGMMAGAIEGAIREKGPTLLLGDDTKDKHKS